MPGMFINDINRKLYIQLPLNVFAKYAPEISHLKKRLEPLQPQSRQGFTYDLCDENGKWLGYQDLNPDKMNQNHLCYHYTIPQHKSFEYFDLKDMNLILFLRFVKKCY